MISASQNADFQISEIMISKRKNIQTNLADLKIMLFSKND